MEREESSHYLIRKKYARWIGVYFHNVQDDEESPK
jgi:hypothetical protein